MYMIHHVVGHWLCSVHNYIQYCANCCGSVWPFELASVFPITVALEIHTDVHQTTPTAFTERPPLQPASYLRSTNNATWYKRKLSSAQLLQAHLEGLVVNPSATACCPAICPFCFEVLRVVSPTVLFNPTHLGNLPRFYPQIVGVSLFGDLSSGF